MKKKVWPPLWNECVCQLPTKKSCLSSLKNSVLKWFTADYTSLIVTYVLMEAKYFNFCHAPSVCRKSFRLWWKCIFVHPKSLSSFQCYCFWFSFSIILIDAIHFSNHIKTFGMDYKPKNRYSSMLAPVSSKKNICSHLKNSRRFLFNTWWHYYQT